MGLFSEAMDLECRYLMGNITIGLICFRFNDFKIVFLIVLLFCFLKNCDDHVAMIHLWAFHIYVMKAPPGFPRS